MPARPRIQPDHVTASYAIGIWNGFVVWVVDGHTPLDQLERLRRRVGEWQRERGEKKSVSLVVLHPSPSGMSSEERRSVARMIEETKRHRAASATVVLAQGVVGAVHRSILTGISILVPPPHPSRVTADVESAIAFLHPHVVRTCGAITPAELGAMVVDLHDALCREKERLARAS